MSETTVSKAIVNVQRAQDAWTTAVLERTAAEERASEAWLALCEARNKARKLAHEIGADL